MPAGNHLIRRQAEEDRRRWEDGLVSWNNDGSTERCRVECGDTQGLASNRPRAAPVPGSATGGMAEQNGSRPGEENRFGRGRSPVGRRVGRRKEGAPVGRRVRRRALREDESGVAGARVRLRGVDNRDRGAAPPMNETRAGGGAAPRREPALGRRVEGAATAGWCGAAGNGEVRRLGELGGLSWEMGEWASWAVRRGGGARPG